MLIFLTIYIIMLGDARWAWRDEKMKYELIISMARKENFDCLHAIICALVLQGDTKHVLTKNYGEQSLSAFAILTHLLRCKYTKLSNELYMIILNVLLVLILN